jgi:hypothetical protein
MFLPVPKKYPAAVYPASRVAPALGRGVVKIVFPAPL